MLEAELHWALKAEGALDDEDLLERRTRLALVDAWAEAARPVVDSVLERGTRRRRNGTRSRIAVPARCTATASRVTIQSHSSSSRRARKAIRLFGPRARNAHSVDRWSSSRSGIVVGRLASFGTSRGSSRT